jgi:hypothetical protein
MASLLGWVVYRFTPKEARNGVDLELYQKAIEDNKIAMVALKGDFL